MFTGLIEEIGKVAEIGPHGTGFRLVVEAPLAAADLKEGDSVAVNGVCLTVVSHGADRFEVGLAPETRARTNLAALQPGAPVNLERAATPTTRLGGHYVQGHVDGVGTVKSFRPDGDALWMAVSAPRGLMRYVASKGYVAIDGASLTVVNVGADWFDVTLIAYSQEKLILPRKTVGDGVNLEVDILAKYVERLIDPALAVAIPAA